MERACGRAYVPAGALQRLAQQLALKASRCVVERELDFAARDLFGLWEQMPSFDAQRRLAVRANCAGFHHVPELAHVSGPIRMFEREQGSGRQLELRQAVALAGSTSEGLGEGCDVFAPFREQRHSDRDAAFAEISPAKIDDSLLEMAPITC